MKRIFSSIVIILALLLTACAGSTERDIREIFDGDTSKESKKLVIWGEVPGADVDELKKAIKYISDNNPYGIELEYVSVQGMNVKLATAKLAGDLPDLILWPRVDTSTYAPKGFLYPIDELIEAGEIDMDVFYQEAVRELQHKGKTYGLPLDIDPWGIWINLDVLNAYNEGLDEDSEEYAKIPETWDELMDTAIKLTKHDAKGNVLVSGFDVHALRGAFYSFLLTVGAQIVDEDKAVVDIDNEKGKLVLNFFNEFYQLDPSIYAPGINPSDAFASGHLAITFGPLFFQREVKVKNPDINMRFISIPAGPVDGVKSGVIGGFGLVVPKGSKNPNNAWNIIKYWATNEEAIMKYNDINSTLPANKNLWNSDSVLNHELYSYVIEEIKNYKVRPTVPGYINFEVQAVFPTIDKLQLGIEDMTVEKALSEIKRIGDRTLALEKE